jgi:uncharacterized SAM-binding protein YcdF (DUF218 family)
MLVRLGIQVQEVPRPLSRELIRLAVLTGLGVAVVAAYATYRIWDQGGIDEQRPADAIVVLGAAQYDGRPSPVFRSRLDHAVALHLAGLAPILIVTGGKAEGDRTTEAETARAYAIAHGVPVEAILVEDRGRTTVESLQVVARIMREYDLRSAVFVSDPTHMLRVLRIATDQGIESWGSPTPSSPIAADVRRRFDATLHELGALAVYFVAGRGTER